MLLCFKINLLTLAWGRFKGCDSNVSRQGLLGGWASDLAPCYACIRAYASDQTKMRRCMFAPHEVTTEHASSGVALLWLANDHGLPLRLVNEDSIAHCKSRHVLASHT